MDLDKLDEEVYSTIFNALRHGVRRNILRILEEGERSHTEIAENLGISSSHLTYHLDHLKDLVTKTEHGYRLSRFGQAAVEMTKTVETPPIRLVKQDQNRLKAIITILSISFLVITGATIQLYSLSSNQNQQMTALGEKVDSVSEELEKYASLEEILESSSSIQLTTGRELTLQREMLTGSPLAPSRYIMVFYAPMDNLSLSIETAIQMPEGFFFPLSLQHGNAFAYPSEQVMNGSSVASDNDFQGPVFWAVNVSSRYQSIKVPLDLGWYTLSWVGPVNVSSDGSVTLDCAWGSSEMWGGVGDFEVWSYCQLLDDEGVVVPFVVDTGVMRGVNRVSMFFSLGLYEGVGGG